MPVLLIYILYIRSLSRMIPKFQAGSGHTTSKGTTTTIIITGKRRTTGTLPW